MLIDQLQNLKELKMTCRTLTEFCCKMPSMISSILMFLTHFIVKLSNLDQSNFQGNCFSWLTWWEAELRWRTSRQLLLIIWWFSQESDWNSSRCCSLEGRCSFALPALSSISVLDGTFDVGLKLLSALTSTLGLMSSRAVHVSAKGFVWSDTIIVVRMGLDNCWTLVKRMMPIHERVEKLKRCCPISPCYILFTPVFGCLSGSLVTVGW